MVFMNRMLSDGELTGLASREVTIHKMVRIVGKHDWFLETQPTSVQVLRSESIMVGLARSTYGFS